MSCFGVWGLNCEASLVEMQDLRTKIKCFSLDAIPDRVFIQTCLDARSGGFIRWLSVEWIEM